MTQGQPGKQDVEEALESIHRYSGNIAHGLARQAVVLAAAYHREREARREAEAQVERLKTELAHYETEEEIQELLK